MDREARELYLVVVQVKDMLGLSGGYSSSTTVTVSLTDVNDNGPTFQHSEWHQSNSRTPTHAQHTSTQKHICNAGSTSCTAFVMQLSSLVGICFKPYPYNAVSPHVTHSAIQNRGCVGVCVSDAVNLWMCVACVFCVCLCAWERRAPARWMNLIIHTWKDICHDLWKQTWPSQR